MVPLTTLIQVAGSRWKVEEGLAGGEQRSALDEHLVPRWESWHRPYLIPVDVCRLLQRLTDHFASGELIFDGVAPWLVRMIKTFQWPPRDSTGSWMPCRHCRNFPWSTGLRSNRTCSPKIDPGPRERRWSGTPPDAGAARPG